MGVVNKMLSPFGLGGEQGDYYDFGQSEGMKALQGASDTSANKFGMANNVNALNLQNQYGIGNQDLASLLSQAGNAYNRPGELSQFTEDLALNPISGSTLAADQLKSNPLLGQIYGQGGAFEGAVAEEKRLRDQGYKLTNDDREAYGQASGDIARQSEQMGNSLAASLAKRGLSAGPSGAAGQLFSGLQGNKFEQLAKMQTDIADKRMQNTMNRINSARTFMNSANQAVDMQHGRNLAGISQRRDFENNYRNFQLDNAKMQETGKNASFESKDAHKGKTIFDALGQGLYSTAQSSPADLMKSQSGGSGGQGGQTTNGASSAKAMGKAGAMA